MASICLIAATAVAASADDRIDRLSDQHRKWIEQEVVYIISDREREAFLDLEAEDEREAFIGAFWRRRDPDPLTPVNEFREEHYRRIEYVNQYFGRESAVPGWMTDRGKIYIVLGEPQDREDFSAVPNLYPTELWFYAQNREKSLPPLNLIFFQEHHAGPYRLFNHFLDDPQDLMPALQLNPFEAPVIVYEMLQEVNPSLAHASLTMRADQGVSANLMQPERVGLDIQGLLSDIYVSPYRRVDTRYIDAAKEARGLVESDYLFNYVPNSGMSNVLPGPANTSFVHFTVEIEPQYMTLAFDEEQNMYYTAFELRGELTTPDNNTIVHTFTKEPFLRLTPSQFRDVGNRPFSYRDMFPVVAGDYQFRLVLKNRARSEYTIFESEVSVPRRVASEVYLGEPVPLYGMANLNDVPSEGEPDPYRTYQLGAVNLEPNGKRTIAVGNHIMAYVPLANVPDEHELRASVVALDAPDVLDAEAKQPTLVTEETYRLDMYEGPFVVRLPMEKLPGGRYRLDIALAPIDGDPIRSSSTAFAVSPLASIPRAWAIKESIDGERIGAVKVALAEQSMRLERKDDAEALLVEALRDDPNLVAARVMLARFRLDQEQYMDAVRLLEPARAQAPDNVEVLLALGDAHFQLGRHDRAAELFEATMDLRRPDPAVLNALGISRAHLGDRDAAIEALTRSLELSPDQSEVQALLEKLREQNPPD
jgi:GWxTD domain-containing protein